jgi:hypothetical protein
MLLPSLLLILSAARLIGLLLRASTSTAQSVTISFTTRARRASTRRPTAFVFPLPACAPGARERCSVSFRSYSGVRVQIKQPLPLFLPCAALREHRSVMRIRSLPSSASGAPRSKSVFTGCDRIWRDPRSPTQSVHRQKHLGPPDSRQRCSTPLQCQ